MTVNQLVVIDSTPQETRVALLEDGMVAELYRERKGERGIAGDIYKGKVTKVLPGMQAAFVNIGFEKDGFLYVADLTDPTKEYRHLLEAESAEAEQGEQPKEDVRHRIAKRGPIQNRLRVGQEILVQVARESLGNKGPKLTSFLTIPGRHLVFMPNIGHVGISRRISKEKERRRLRKIVHSLRESHEGFIIRTVTEGTTKADLESDVEILRRQWEHLVAKGEKAKAPSLIYRDLDLVLKAARDFLSSRAKVLVINDLKDYRRLVDFCREFLPKYQKRIKLYEGREPIFDHYQVEAAIGKALEKKVGLKSGGYIVIDETEALVTIDVNTGRFVGRRSLEETILKTNLEAAREIAYQLRLRNIGGIIILDFIDMESKENRDKLFQALKEVVKKDRARTMVLKVSDLGLVEMTRKRVQESLAKSLCRSCPYCGGKERIKSNETIAFEVFREIKRSGKTLKGNKLLAVVHPEIASVICDREWKTVERLEKETGKKISVITDPGVHHERFDIVPI